MIEIKEPGVSDAAAIVPVMADPLIRNKAEALGSSA